MHKNQFKLDTCRLTRPTTSQNKIDLHQICDPFRSYCPSIFARRVQICDPSNAVVDSKKISHGRIWATSLDYFCAQTCSNFGHSSLCRVLSKMICTPPRQCGTLSSLCRLPFLKNSLAHLQPYLLVHPWCLPTFVTSCGEVSLRPAGPLFEELTWTRFSYCTLMILLLVMVCSCRSLHQFSAHGSDRMSRNCGCETSWEVSR